MSMYTLWCLIDGTKSQFDVEIPINSNISALKRKIKQDCSPLLDKFGALDLIFWKIDVDARDQEIEERINAGQYRPQPFPAKPLNAADAVSVIWPGPPNDRIQVFISLPSPLDRTSDDDDPESNLSWLKEIHSKIWSKEGLKPQLFRTIQVTQAHYAALQNHLKVLYPDRGSPDYNGNKNVLSVKLEFLRSEEALSPHLSDDNVQVDDDDFEIHSLFPSSLSYLDLSTLGLKASVPMRFPLPLLLRQEYKDITDLIKTQPQSIGGSVVISGQPGTGKTSYLFLRIIEHMIKGLPFLYQARRGTIYHVSKDGVQVIRSWSSDETIAAFVDGDAMNFEPKDILHRHSVQLIVASSPKGTYPPWSKQLGSGSHVTQIAVKLWSYEELLLTGIFLHRSDLSFKLLRESSSYFGYNPRRCFDITSSGILAQNMVEIAALIKDIVNDWNDIVKLLHNTRTGVSNVSHTIFQIYPADTDTERLLLHCQYEAVSGWALNLLLQQYEVSKANVAAEFYHKLSGMPEAATLQSHLFKRQVLKHLCGIDTEVVFRIRGLTYSNQTEWTYCGSIPNVAFRDSAFFSEITKAVQKQEPLHLIPLSRSFPTVDSILYDPNDSKAVLTCIQITMNKDHPIAVSGLKRLQSFLKLKTPLKDLRPSEKRPWRFLFVVPFGMADEFQSQTLSTDKTKSGVGDWAGKVEQYVLGLEEDTIFGRRSDLSAQHGMTSQQGEQQMMDVDDN